jgi:Phage gp6-like head-tail connector protein
VTAGWVPTLTDVKIDLRIEDTIDDGALQLCLDSAVAFVQGRHRDRYNVDEDPFSTLPSVPGSVRLGTVRLAGRWYIRRRSPDGLIATADFGTSRIPSIDADIERLLMIGRYSKAVIG